MDLSERHISQGRQRIAALGIENIELRQGDLAAAKFHRQKFDYVICHGVFSWVPKSVQDAIFRTCDEVLTENGMATISYNVLPGWHLRNIVRDICIYHVGRAGPPRERVAKARGVLESIAQSTNQTEPYGVLLRSEAKRIARRPSAYILGEFLVARGAQRIIGDGVDQRLEAQPGAAAADTRLLANLPPAKRQDFLDSLSLIVTTARK